MKLKSVAIAGIVTLAVAMGGASASYAAPAKSGLTASIGTAVPQDSGVTITDLIEASATQTPKEIAAIVASASASNPVEIYVSASGKHLAAIAEPAPELSPMAITPVGPGCTTTSACIHPYNGYTGSGVLAINVSSKKVSAGDRGSSFWVGNVAHYTSAYTSLNWTFNQRFTSINRL